MGNEKRHASVANKPLDSGTSSVEAVLFLSRQPLTSRKLALLAGLADGTKARTLVRSLNRRYDAQGSAFRAEEVAGGHQLRTRSKFAPWLRRLHAVPTEVRLSGSALETLAVVAYRQPVVRAEIEAIRGVQSGEVLRQLMERELVRIAGRSDELGRPFLYGTTKQFLQVFGLRHLDELPRADVLRQRGPVIDRSQAAGISPDPEISNLSNQSQAVEEEKTVKALIATKNRQTIAENHFTGVTGPRRNDRTADQSVFARHEDEEDDIEDEDDDFEDEEDEDEEEDEEDLDDEPWEEVEDEDEELEDEDEDDDWEDEDEDWEDEDEDWDEDEDEEEEEEEEDEDEEV
jgi:segregation and condensation protein B